LRHGYSEAEWEGIKIISEKCAKKHRQQDLPTGQDCPEQQYWEYVKKAESNIDLDPPIDDGDDRDKKSREYDPRDAFEVRKKHDRFPQSYGQPELKTRTSPKDNLPPTKRYVAGSKTVAIVILAVFCVGIGTLFRTAVSLIVMMPQTLLLAIGALVVSLAVTPVIAQIPRASDPDTDSSRTSIPASQPTTRLSLQSATDLLIKNNLSVSAARYNVDILRAQRIAL